MYHSRFKGSHYEAGFKYGNILSKNNINPLSKIKISKERKDFSDKCMPIYKEFFPKIIEEIKGIADGLSCNNIKINYKDIADFLFTIYAFTFENKCSSFAFKTDDDIILAKNSDFIKSIKKYCDSVYYKLIDSYSFIANTTAFIEMEDGINENGLACALTFVYPVKINYGFNAGMLVRLVECNCDKKHIIKNDYVFTSNHFVSECMRVYQTDLEDDVHSHERYNTLENAFKNYKYNLDFSKELLSGKYGFMCQYEKKDDIDTIWSSIYSIKDKKIYRAEGNPSRNSFKEDKRLNFSY